MVSVTITQAELKANNACSAYLKSPEWNGEALVYSNWDATAQRLLSTRSGITYLDWLIAHKLVPMTLAEFTAARAAHGVPRS